MLTFDWARDALPDMFHTSRNIIVFSERARVVMEDWTPGRVEFIPVACQAEPRMPPRLNFASAYYFINVLGRAQRLQWFEVPTHAFRRSQGECTSRCAASTGCVRAYANSASSASIRASIGVGPNCEAIRFASVRCWTAS